MSGNMSIWKVVYFPSEDQKQSPVNYIKNLPENEANLVLNRLLLISQREPNEWLDNTWTKIWDGKIWQLDGTQTRVLLCRDTDELGERKIVVLHACKKQKQKTHPRDAQRAKNQYAKYREGRSK